MQSEHAPLLGASTSHVDTDDKLPSWLDAPYYTFLDNLVIFGATVFAGWSLQPRWRKYRTVSGVLNVLHQILFAPLAEASIRKRNFDAAQTSGVWGVLKALRFRRQEEKKPRRFWMALYLFACWLFPLDNIVGIVKTIYYMCSTRSANRTTRYTLLYDFSTAAKDLTSLGAGLLFLCTIRGRPLFATSADTIDNLNIISVICGRVGSVAADLAKSASL